MKEILNWTEKLRRNFEGFEPNVKGDWNAMERRLDASGHSSYQSEIVRRMKSAQRFAFGASAIAAGLALWVLLPTLNESDMVAIALEQDLTNEAETKAWSVHDDSKERSVNGEASGAYEGATNQHVQRLPLKLDPSLIGPSLGGTEDPFGRDVTARTTTTFVLNLPEMTVHAPRAAEVEDSPRTSEKEGVDIGRNEGLRVPAVSSAMKEEVEGIANSTVSKAVDDAIFNISAQEACAGTEVSFALNGMNERASVLWNFGDGGFSQQESPSHIYEDAGTYDITVSVRAPGDGTIRTRTVENMIVVRPKPEAEMSWAFEDANATRANVHLIDNTLGASSSTWIMGQQDISSSIMLNIPGEYHVNLIASNAFGCQDVSVETIRLGDRKEAIAPAMFSPNGDGRYDTFMPLMVMDFREDWTLTIWDETSLVFETSDLRGPWDGTFMDGQKAVSGKSYVWKLETTSKSGERYLYVDNVFIDVD